MRIEDEGREFPCEGKVEAFGNEDQFATRCYDNRSFIGGEDLLDIVLSGIGRGSVLGGLIRFEAGVLATQFLGVETGEGLCGCRVLPHRQVEQRERFGTGLLGRRAPR